MLEKYKLKILKSISSDFQHELIEQVKSNLEKQTATMITGVIKISKMQARDVMIARAQMIIIEENMSLNAVKNIIINSKHSRFPIIGEHRDEILGILLAKDLLMINDDQEFDVKQYMREASFIPESRRLNDILTDFQDNHNHMAIVVDEYGGNSGLVTIEDIIEQIVGDIEDEHFESNLKPIKQLTKSSYIVSGLCPIEELNEELNTNIPVDEFDTIGGIVAKHFGYLPKNSESITISNLKFTIQSMGERRIKSVKVETFEDSQ